MPWMTRATIFGRFYFTDIQASIEAKEEAGRMAAEEKDAAAAALQAGPGIYGSPHHRLPLNKERKFQMRGMTWSWQTLLIGCRVTQDTRLHNALVYVRGNICYTLAGGGVRGAALGVGGVSAAA